jgi:peptide/nickel transport system ATP-binding protein
MTADSLLSVDSLTISARSGTLVDDISFEIGRGSRVGLIGESGSGKTLTALSILGLLPEGVRAEGRIDFSGTDLLDLDEDELCSIRGDGISMVFQEPMTALNPVMRVGNQIAEALVIHRGMSRRDARSRAIEELRVVGIPDVEAKARAYPHQLSGGQRQRVMIAMAIACGPDLVIADEPTTALDVTVQAQVLHLLHDLVVADDTALLLITHDLPVVAGMCDEVLVMHEGVIVERGPTRGVFDTPQEDYTKKLIASVPELSRTSDARPGGSASVVPTVSREASAMVIVEHVSRSFALPRSKLSEAPGIVTAVSDVSLTVDVGESFGIVGESGSGKTTLARMIVGLDHPSEGTISVAGIDVAGAHERDLKELRRTAQMVFQDPMGSLDPRMKVGSIIAEPLRSLRIPGDHRERVAELLEAVALPPDTARRYAHEFSGGQRQRIAVARALAPHPRLLVADEPVSALDMTVQTLTLELLADLKRRFDLTLVFISHDLSVVHEVCDRVAVMQNGEIVEAGDADEVYGNPRHDYTVSLLGSIPRLDGTLPKASAS